MPDETRNRPRRRINPNRTSQCENPSRGDSISPKRCRPNPRSPTPRRSSRAVAFDFLTTLRTRQHRVSRAPRAPTAGSERTPRATKRARPASRRAPGQRQSVIAENPDHVPMARPRSFSLKRRTDQGEASGNQQRAADSLHRARRDQLIDVRGQAAGRGHAREHHDADVEDEAPAVVIAE